MSPNAHSPLGASNASRWMACPGSVAAMAALPPAPTSPDAALGTAAHALAELCLLNGATAESHIGTTIEAHVVTESMADAVQLYLDTVRECQRRMPHATLYVERRVDLSWLHPQMFGTTDAMLIEPWGPAVVIDYKNGANAVEVTGPQMPYYGLDAYHAHDCDSVECVIVQPNAAHPDGPVRSITYTRDQMTEWADRFREAAVAAEKPDAQRSAGEHCRYCTAAGSCPALHQHAVIVAQGEFAPVVKPPDPYTLSPEAVAVVLEHATTIEAWLEAVRKHALALANTGVPVPGYKLVEGRRGNRAWSDEAAAANALKALGVDPYEQVLLTPGAIEKRIGKGAKAMLAQVAALISQSPGRPQLVPVADRRPPLTASAVLDFTDSPAA